MTTYIQANPNPVRNLHEQGDRAKLVNLIRYSQKDLTRRNVIYLAIKELNVTHEQANAILWKCLHPETAYLIEIEIN